MPYIINTKKISLGSVFKNVGIVSFLEKSIEVSKGLDIGCYKKLVYNKDIFSIPQNTLLKESSVCIFESHKEYIDIHVIVDGFENVELLDIKEVNNAYEKNLESDYYLYESNSDTKNIILDKNTIGIFLIEDVHKVGIQLSNAKTNVIKVVLKIKKDVFKKEFIYA